MAKLVDVKCEACGKVVEDVLVSGPASPGQTVQVDDPPNCGDTERQTCGPFKVIMSVARHSKHSSWSTS